MKAFIEMAQALFHVAGVNYILSEKLCQDPVESFFFYGKQRAAEAAMIIPQSKIFVRIQYHSSYKDQLLLLLSEIVKDNRITNLWMMLHYQKDLEKRSNCCYSVLNFHHSVFRLFKFFCMIATNK